MEGAEVAENIAGQEHPFVRDFGIESQRSVGQRNLGAGVIGKPVAQAAIFQLPARIERTDAPTARKGVAILTSFRFAN